MGASSLVGSFALIVGQARGHYAFVAGLPERMPMRRGNERAFGLDAAFLCASLTLQYEK
jgi:hypothetical protein